MTGRPVYIDDEAPQGKPGWACENGHPWCNRCPSPLELPTVNVGALAQGGRMTPEQLRDEIARDDATMQEVQHITARYQRHTVDIDRQPMTVQDETPPTGFTGATVAWIAMGAVVVGCLIGQFVLAHVFGG